MSNIEHISGHPGYSGGRVGGPDGGDGGKMEERLRAVEIGVARLEERMIHMSETMATKADIKELLGKIEQRPTFMQTLLIILSTGALAVFATLSPMLYEDIVRPLLAP